ncbi:bifunctional RNase H/acid phosphatase [Catellatospora tritici]|uniref:bifunctional RNase H/acid phosphatase n=1 Tax=Catellatospora tritici TaxID=2851566 RepID=UPI001C2D5672|nr:bifunctional RNase H/acid phosphatase [Catellatospora tritici]MBV1848729.1 bifunctional RNase H/acid phosphatase [Catellatospora tritici]
MRVVVEADGGARGNPGPAGYGAVVRDAASGQVLAERAAAIGVATNNVAEYRGLIAGLEAAAELGATLVEVRMDSKLVVEQMSGRWQIKHQGLRPLAAQAAALVRKFDQVTYGWIPRERNRAADALANAAMDAAAAGGAVIEHDAAVATAVAVTEPKQDWAPRTAPATRLILVRHGETPLTAQKRYSGRGDVPLSERGELQAAATARRVAGLGPDRVICSPLKRCKATARAIAKAAGGVPVEVEPELIECDFGAWEGLTFGEVRDQYAAELSAWLASTSVAPPGGESFQKVAKRVRGVVGRLQTQYEGSTLAVVSHVSPIKLILRDALAASDAFLHRLLLDPAGVSIVDTWPDGGVSVRVVNDTAHLADL